MKIKNFFEEKKLVFSLEVFPPKGDIPIETTYKTLEDLRGINPDYISVTYGAGGNSLDNRTCEVSSIIKNKHNVESLAHLTCIGSTKENIDNILDELKSKNINNILALRGDLPKDREVVGEYKYAYELIKHIKKRGDFGIAAACYPEGHMNCESLEEEINRLKQKVDCGVDYLITQMFFDNNLFYDFLNKAKKKNINTPIEVGIMPVINKKQIERINSLCGATIPKKFIKILDKYGHDKEALRDAGIAYAIDQIVDLISTGVEGIHLYTMNNSYVAKRINESICSIVKSTNKKI